MTVQEWKYIDKEEWGAGPWSEEPDKVQWVDEDSGLDCLMVRNPYSGNWCGYVAVAEGHPLFGVEYSTPSEALAAAVAARVQQPIGEHPSFSLVLRALMGGELEPTPDNALTVHGGITYAAYCTELTRETWARWRERMLHIRDTGEVAQYPNGDAARQWREDGHLLDEPEAWIQKHQQQAICHIPEPGRPVHVWWFGFDCAHHMDLSPGYASSLPSLVGGVYRDRAYVEDQCRQLAMQLAALA